MTADEYFDLLIIEFPIIKKEIEDEGSNMFHFKMELFADYTIHQIETKNVLELERCFAFQESKIDLMNPNLENALVVSYCESLLLGKIANQMNEIIEYMPEKLKSKYQEYEVHYNKLIESSKKK